MRRLAPLLAVGLLAACDPDDGPPAATPTPEPTPIPQRCLDEDGESGLVDGIVRDLGHNPVPIVGEEVWEWQCGEAPALTRLDGAFAMNLQRRDDAVIQVAVPDYVPVVVGSPGDESEWGLEVPIYLRSEEEIFREQDFGEPYDATRGAVLVHLYSFGGVAASEWTANTRASIDLDYRSVWILDETDEHLQGDTVPEDSSSSEIWFSNVVPGTVTITLEPPDFIVCDGPTELPVYADTYTHANYNCAPME